MHSRPLWKLPFFLLAFVFILSGCNDNTTPSDANNLYDSDQLDPQTGDWVIVGWRSDADAINPYTYRGGEASEVISHLFHSLLAPDTLSGMPTPELAVARPEISEDFLRLTFEIRPEATWDNGDPITAKDVEFSVKYFKNPNVNAGHMRQIHSYLKDFEADPDNPKRFTFILDEPFFLSEWYLGDLFVLPKHVYDPDGLMDEFTVRQMSENEDLMVKESKLIQFGELANSEKYQRDPSFIQGSGPYQLEEWVTGQTIKVKRKKEWWGNKVEGSEYIFNAWPDKVVFKVINSPEAQIAEIRQQGIDAMASLPTREFENLRTDTLLTQHYRFSTEPTYIYTLIGMNCRPPSDRTPFFEDKRVRNAIGYLLDIDLIIEQVYNGMGDKITSPIHPTRPEYNQNLKARPVDLEKAKALLEEAGWTDTDGDGYRDKEINGKRVKFSFDFLIATASATAKPVALIMQDDFKKAGLELNITPKDFSVIKEDYRSHQFDMAGMAFSFSPYPPDMAQLWHTNSWESSGSNYFGFGTAETDSLIESIRTEPDEAKRKQMYDRLQEIIFDDAPGIFMMVPLEKYAIHKRFRNSWTHAMRPGYTTRGFWTPKEHIRYPEAE